MNKLVDILLDRKILVYIAVMGIGWLVDNVLFFISNYFLSIPIALLVGRVSGAVSGFYLHNKYSFSDQIKRSFSWEKAIKYSLVWIASYCVMVFGVEYLVYSFDLLPIIAKILLEFIIIPTNYILLRTFVYV